MLTQEKKKELIDLGYLREIAHPNGELFLYNYTQSAQFDKAFVQHPELYDCRGLVLDKNSNIIAKPFRKFFNFEEYGVGSTLGELPHFNHFEITEKLDGSLIIVFFYKSQMFVATRGSFDSDQAKIADEILRREYPFFVKRYSKENFPYTFLFELIGSKNRIVVQYPFEAKLVMLGIVDVRTGDDVATKFCQEEAKDRGMEFVKVYDGITDFKTCREFLPQDNAEGFVIRFDNGLRVKMKYTEYCRLHKILTGISSKTIWEMLMNGDDFGLVLEKVPDEFMEWVKETKKKLEQEYTQYECLAKDKLDFLLARPNDYPTRKDKAINIINTAPNLSSIIFQMLDNRSYSETIWKLCKPKYEQPFKQDDAE